MVTRETPPLDALACARRVFFLQLAPSALFAAVEVVVVVDRIRRPYQPAASHAPLADLLVARRIIWKGGEARFCGVDLQLGVPDEDLGPSGELVIIRIGPQARRAPTTAREALVEHAISIIRRPAGSDLHLLECAKFVDIDCGERQQQPSSEALVLL